MPRPLASAADAALIRGLDLTDAERRDMAEALLYAAEQWRAAQLPDEAAILELDALSFNPLLLN